MNSKLDFFVFSLPDLISFTQHKQRSQIFALLHSTSHTWKLQIVSERKGKKVKYQLTGERERRVRTFSLPATVETQKIYNENQIGEP
jgi:hypothetical protein